MGKITYTNKTTINVNPGVPANMKCQASDMNEIKQVVNNNYDEVGNLADLNTINKSSIVGAINSTITERGTGYTKYADGTMICYGTKSINLSASTPWGSLYATTVQTGIDFAQEFIEVPVVTMIISCSGNNGWIMAVSQPTTKKTPQYNFVRATQSNVTGNVEYIAIGKWK